MKNVNELCISITYSYCGKKRSITNSDDTLTILREETDTGMRVLLFTNERITLLSARLSARLNYDKDDRIFVNGYQPWTDSKEFYINERLNDIRRRVPNFLIKKYAFDRYGDAFFKNYEKNVIHGYDISYIIGKNDLFISSENRQNAFLIINHDVANSRLVLESDVNGLEMSGRFTVFDFNILFDNIENSKDKLFGEKKDLKNIIGYTSWYNHYQNIDEKKIVSALEDIDARFNLFQIDDGFETYVGDWLDTDFKKFPSGLEPIVKKIHEKGLDAGIWLAPFAAEANSAVFKEHPDWFLRDECGNHILCGSNWSGFYALDFYNEEARKYIEKCLRAYTDLGFDFFKLDFLYAVCVKTPKNKTRASVSYEAYKFLREKLPGKIILGCGATLSSAYDLFDYMRIGPDVSLSFDDTWFMRFMHRERISTKTTLQNTVYRSLLDKRVFGCDPDVFLLRKTNIKLNKEQKKSLIILNALFGSVMMTSDNIGAYDDKSNELFDHALEIMRFCKVKKYSRSGKNIVVEASMRGKDITYVYNTEKGVISENG